MTAPYRAWGVVANDGRRSKHDLGRFPDEHTARQAISDAIATFADYAYFTDGSGTVHMLRRNEYGEVRSGPPDITPIG